MNAAPSKRRMEMMCGGKVKGYEEGGEIEEFSGPGAHEVEIEIQTCPNCGHEYSAGGETTELEAIKAQDAETAPGNADRSDDDFMRAVRRRRMGGAAS